jgi:hypothetical protein
MQKHLRWGKVLPLLLVLELDQGGEEQDHVAALVHDGRSAVCTAHFARQLVPGGLLLAVVPAQIVVAVGEVDVLLVEDRGPLEGSS